MRTSLSSPPVIYYNISFVVAGRRSDRPLSARVHHTREKVASAQMDLQHTRVLRTRIYVFVYTRYVVVNCLRTPSGGIVGRRCWCIPIITRRPVCFRRKSKGGDPGTEKGNRTTSVKRIIVVYINILHIRRLRPPHVTHTIDMSVTSSVLRVYVRPPVHCRLVRTPGQRGYLGAFGSCSGTRRYNRVFVSYKTRSAKMFF